MDENAPRKSEETARRVGLDINMAVGRTIRELRDLKRMTARDLGLRAGVSPAMISRVESGQVSPSLSVLEMLAAALEVPMVSLFRDTGSAVADFTHVKKGQGLKSTRLMGQHIHDFVMLGFHRRRDLQFESLLVTIERNENTSPPTYTGHGCVFVYVLEGEAIYRYGQQEVKLGEGDSLCLDAELRYGIQEVLSPRLRFLSVQAERR
ncbi:MAG: helix-turn-helix transcriptional regulator [Methylobacterium sp.]|jgi:transcriptional regulator with XRE-family HTH domain|nr:helix-turn-helix transcriptional regulator [Methylobacterium sp.]MCA3607174.1 helix-turn-helix transcriptional regulator [Methylobacterium sp.]MCA3608537.1 helix-turn-helix transcriptional regulator [Methylobacterium sp.]MCA3611410.1 helix-turn-helix transcriptional regulator [Methylobacterium sp.]MCA3617462.1 helix-turn-helix transcriptional regulator [Methylobacterium sp.]